MESPRLFTRQFIKDLIGTIAFFAFLYFATHNPHVRPMPKPDAGKWSIQFMQHPLLFGFAGHNYLALRDGSGKIVSELHGLATDPVSDDWRYIGTRSTDLLRVWEFGDSKYIASKSYPGIILAQGDNRSMETLWNLGRKCKDRINSTKIYYPPYGFSVRSETTNSNSVAYTLARCMHLNTKHIGLITPGAKLDLLDYLESTLTR